MRSESGVPRETGTGRGQPEAVSFLGVNGWRGPGALAIVFCAFVAAFASERVLGRAFFARIADPPASHPGAPATVEVVHITSQPALWACAIPLVTQVLVAAYAACRCIEMADRTSFNRLAQRVGLSPAKVFRAGTTSRPPEPTS